MKKAIINSEAIPENTGYKQSKIKEALDSMTAEEIEVVYTILLDYVEKGKELPKGTELAIKAADILRRYPVFE